MEKQKAMILKLCIIALMFLTYRMYIPLYPRAAKGSNINYIEGKGNNIALALGVGIKIK